MAEFDGFISYGHAADARIAPALQSALQRLTKPWWRRRALHVFCDTTALSANHALWSAITDILDETEYLIVLASPDSARSIWVGREIEHWRANKPDGKILIALTEGELLWDDATGDFDPVASTALAPALLGAFAQEPLYVDLRFARETEDLSLTNHAFLGAAAEIAAPIHGVAKDEIVGEDLRQHHRTRRTAWAAVAVVGLLAVASLVAGLYALRKADEVLAANKSIRELRDVRTSLQHDIGDARRGLEDAVAGQHAAEDDAADANAEANRSNAEAGRANAAADGANDAAETAQQAADAAQENAAVAQAQAGQQELLALAAVNARDRARNQQSSAESARNAALRDKGTAEGERDTARNDKKTAEGDRDKARDDQRVAEGALDDARTESAATTMAVQAQRKDLLDASPDLALLLANAATQVQQSDLPAAGSVAAAAVTPAQPTAASRLAQLELNQTTTGIERVLQFDAGVHPQDFGAVSVNPSGSRVAAVETSSAILDGRRSPRLFVWDGHQEGSHARELTQDLPDDDPLRCVADLGLSSNPAAYPDAARMAWDRSGRYLFTVEDPAGCLDPSILRRVRIWDTAAGDASDAVHDVCDFGGSGFAQEVTSPLSFDATRNHAAVGCVTSDGTNVFFWTALYDFTQAGPPRVTLLANFRLPSSVYGGRDFAAGDRYLVGVDQSTSGAVWYPLDGSNPVDAFGDGIATAIDDPNVRSDVAFDPDGQIVAAVAGSGTLAFFDPATGEERVDLRREDLAENVGTIALGRPGGAPMAAVQLCEATCASATIDALDWSLPDSGFAWAQHHKIDHLLSDPSSTIQSPALLSFSEGSTYLAANWFTDHGLNTRLIEPATGAGLRDINGELRATTGTDERFVVGQERTFVQDENQGVAVVIHVRVWDMSRDDSASGRAGVLVRTENNAEVVTSADGSKVAIVPALNLVTTGAQPEPTVFKFGNEGLTTEALAAARFVHTLAYDNTGRLWGAGEGLALVWGPGTHLPYTSLATAVAGDGLSFGVAPDARLLAVTQDRLSFSLVGLAGQGGSDPISSQLDPGEEIDSLAFTRDGSLLLVVLRTADGLSSSLVYRVGAAPGGTPTASFVEKFLGEEATTSSGNGRLVLFRAFDAPTPLDTTHLTVRTYSPATNTLSTGVRVDVNGLPEDDEEFGTNLYALNLDGTMVAGTNATGRGMVWRVADSTVVLDVRPATEQPDRVPVYGVAFHPDGTALALNSPDHRVRLYPLGKGLHPKPRTEKRLSSDARARMKFSDDGALLLVDGTYLLDGSTLESVSPRLRPGAWSRDLGTFATFFTPGSDPDLIEVRQGFTEVVRWELSPTALAAEACAVANRNLTRAEAEAVGFGPAGVDRAVRMCADLPAGT